MGLVGVSVENGSENGKIRIVRWEDEMFDLAAKVAGEVVDKGNGCVIIVTKETPRANIEASDRIDDFKLCERFWSESFDSVETEGFEIWKGGEEDLADVVLVVIVDGDGVESEGHDGRESYRPNDDIDEFEVDSAEARGRERRFEINKSKH